jgi:SM-20-related protein
VTKHHETEKWLDWVDELSHSNYVIVDNFLNDAFYQKIRSFFLNTIPQFSQAGIGALDDNLTDKSIRGDHTYWLDRQRDQHLNDFWSLVDETISIYNRYCFLSLSGYEFHLAHYPPGTGYETHLDQFEGRNNRMISVVIYLNEGWQPGDGGELEIINEDGSKVVVEPHARRCVMFKSADVPHGVLKSRTNRFSLTGWLLYQPSALGQFFG